MLDEPESHGSWAKCQRPCARAAALVRTRIEPKTFFANERTFLAWLTIAVMVMFMGLSLLDGSNLVANTMRARGLHGRICGGEDSCRAVQVRVENSIGCDRSYGAFQQINLYLGCK